MFEPGRRIVSSTVRNDASRFRWSQTWLGYAPKTLTGSHSEVVDRHVRLNPRFRLTGAYAAPHDTPGSRSVGVRANRYRLVAQKLFAEDIGVAAMLRQLAQYVEIHPAQREWATPVALDDVVQGQLRGHSA